VGEQLIADNFPLGTQLGNGATEIDGVPEDDGGNGEIEVRRPVSLIFIGDDRFRHGVQSLHCGHRVLEAGEHAVVVSVPISGRPRRFAPSYYIANRFHVLTGHSRKKSERRNKAMPASSLALRAAACA
jgi:hypothetical protein